MNRNKFTISSKFTFAALALVAMFVLNASVSATASKLAINAGYYGGSIIVSGEGFESGDYVTVSLSASGAEAIKSETSELASWRVAADADGGFITSVSAEGLYSPNGRYIVRAVGDNTKTVTEIEVSALPNPSADLDQCANGPFSGPVPCTGSAWQNGNVGQNSGHYYEGDAIPYRMKFDNVTVNSANTVTIEWDTTQGGKHAIDYLMSYNYTEAVGNNPCSGVAGCGAASTFPIPLDPNVSGAGVTQIGGQVFTMFGGTITSVSAYSLSGSYGGNSSTQITISFTANTTNPVLAWGGHIADRNDWSSLGGSASSIPGSPYHMRLISFNGGGGNQDRSLSNVAVRLNTKLIIIKQASPESATAFPFTTTGSGLSAFTLWDDGVDNDATPNNITFEQLLGSGSGSFSVTESAPTNFYQLTAASCSVATGGTSTWATTLATRTINITMQYGDTVTCTFTNTVVTAANATVSGRVADANGVGIGRTKVTITNPLTGTTFETVTNQFGRYSFDELEVGEFYVVSVSNRRYAFETESISFTLNDAIDNLDFTASAP